MSRHDYSYIKVIKTFRCKVVNTSAALPVLNTLIYSVFMTLGFGVALYRKNGVWSAAFKPPS